MKNDRAPLPLLMVAVPRSVSSETRVLNRQEEAISISSQLTETKTSPVQNKKKTHRLQSRSTTNALQI
jgi:phosphatidate phosphatase APP1